MTSSKLPKGFFKEVPVKSRPSRSDDKHETPISLSHDIVKGNKKVKVVLVHKKSLKK